MGSFYFIFSASNFESRGIDKAKKIVDAINNNNYRSVSVGDFKDVALLYCGSRNCAAYDFKSKKILYFPSSNFSISSTLSIRVKGK